jgi:peptidoglycan/LPS O-acetylase OafA/YrhL
LGIQLFTNVPYWSLNYEVWYYVLFGVLFFFEGRRRRIMFGLLCLLLGPKIMLLMPVWWMGVWIYRAEYLANLSKTAAWMCLILSLVGGYWYVYVNLGQWGWDYLKQLMGPDLHLQLFFSRQFISDYDLGAMLSLHFVGLRVLLARVDDLPKRLTLTVRYLAGATFSIYLFHQPLLWFYSTVFASVEEGLPRYLLVVPCTLVSVFVLSAFTEKKKDLWKRWVEQVLGLIEQAASRFRQAFAR